MPQAPDAAKVSEREQEAREYERRGNAAMANGLVLKARRNYRIAGAIRSGR